MGGDWDAELEYRDFQQELKRLEDRKYRSDRVDSWERLDNPLEQIYDRVEILKRIRKRYENERL